MVQIGGQSGKAEDILKLNVRNAQGQLVPCQRLPR